jgi:hypothetical protein
MDNFYEQLENTEKPTKYKIMNGAMYVFAVLSAMFLFALQIILFIIAIAITVALFFLKKKAYVEYEYVFTNGEVDIDVIYEMKKRKRLASFNIKSVELLAEESSYYVKDFSNKPDKQVKGYLANSDKKVYIAMITGGVERLQLFFTPDKGFLDVCCKYNPRAIKKM